MTIKKHTKEYIHIRKRSFGYFFLTLFLILLTIGSFIVLIDSWRFLGLGGLECSKEDCSYNFHQLLILPILIINYIIISLTLCSFVSMFKKLKKHSEKGSVYELIDGLIDGLLVGLVFGLIIGLVFGLQEELK